MWHCRWVNYFFNRSFLNTINLIWWKNEPKFFFGSLSFSEPILLNYCLIIQYMEFLFVKTFIIFDRLTIKEILNYGLKFKVFTWDLNFIHWSWQFSSDLYIISCENFNIFICVVLADIYYCSYLNCWYMFRILIWLFACR